MPAIKLSHREPAVPHSSQQHPSQQRRYPIGAELVLGGVSFRVWAPGRRRVDVVIERTSQSAPTGRREHELTAEQNGYFSGHVDGVAAGSLYGFRLDGNEHAYADPASRFQPNGPAGPSQVVDPRGFCWTDAAWRGIEIQGQVMYEMHLGTFTPEGTWRAAAEQLSELARAGITVLELMPVADFPGEFGWGYDGVNMFAPTRLYGPPDDFRHFVDRAHRHGLAVILDVVFNHFGNVDNYIYEFSQDYHTTRYQNEWAAAINFDGDNSGPVREFFETNVRYWVEEYHIDGYRFDATQAIHDASDEHILTRLTAAARSAAGDRHLLIVAENEPQQVRAIRPNAAGGWGMDGIWNDDFHHSSKVRLIGHNTAYYSDFRGSADELIAAIKRGFLFQGQVSQWQGKPRGSPTTGFPASAFVHFLDNHDQIANSATGERVYQLTSPGRFRAMTALWLLSPQTPMFFQGQEFGASSPFLYFANYSGELAKVVREGRGKFLAQFPALATPEAQRQLPDPADESVFARCKLDFAERESNRPLYDLHIDLLKLRRDDPVFRQQRADLLDAASLGPDSLVVRHFDPDGRDRLLVANFGKDFPFAPAPEPLLAPPEGTEWQVLWSSENTRYGGRGTPALQVDDGWRLPGETTVVLRAVREPQPIGATS